MSGKKYKIFGAGPAGLYAAWRLLSSGKLTPDDTLELVEWGKYSFPGIKDGTRNPAGRICSYHYKGNPQKSYIEIGGMRYLEWDGHQGHQLVTKTIDMLGLSDQVIDFNTTDNPLFYLRRTHYYQEQLGVKGFTAPYNTRGDNVKPADNIFSRLARSVTGDKELTSRSEQCEFYHNDRLPLTFRSSVYQPGDRISNIGYWNLFYDQANNEGVNYAADAGGYSSNVINSNTANAVIYNSDFAPGGSFKTLNTGFSTLFSQLYAACDTLAAEKGINFTLTQERRLHSIWHEKDGTIKFHEADASKPFKACDTVAGTADIVFLALPPRSLEMVAEATQYADMSDKIDFLNDQKVKNFSESVILQPSNKIAMFFHKEWWKTAPYPPKLGPQDNEGKQNVFGPTITDLPLRQIYYFGDNAAKNNDGEDDENIYGILASYDDMRFTTFWREMELSVSERRETPISQNYQPIHGAGQAPDTMVRMLLLELAKVHYGTADAAAMIPYPRETIFMDWGLNPFGAGYHAWAAHYDIIDVMQQLRTPGRMAGVSDSQVYIIGSAYSNDQSWIEGAFCTTESVLTDYLGIDTIADPTVDYPFIPPYRKAD